MRARTIQLVFSASLPATSFLHRSITVNGIPCLLTAKWIPLHLCHDTCQPKTLILNLTVTKYSRNFFEGFFVNENFDQVKISNKIFKNELKYFDIRFNFEQKSLDMVLNKGIVFLRERVNVTLTCLSGATLSATDFFGHFLCLEMDISTNDREDP